MLRTSILIAIMLTLMASVSSAATPNNYLTPGRAQLFDGSQSGVRSAYQTFDEIAAHLTCACRDVPDLVTHRTPLAAVPVSDASFRVIVQTNGGGMFAVLLAANTAKNVCCPANGLIAACGTITRCFGNAVFRVVDGPPRDGLGRDAIRNHALADLACHDLAGFDRLGSKRVPRSGPGQSYNKHQHQIFHGMSSDPVAVDLNAEI